MLCFGLVFVRWFFLFSCFASAGGCFDLSPRVLDDRQCFIARSAMRKKKAFHQDPDLFKLLRLYKSLGHSARNRSLDGLFNLGC